MMHDGRAFERLAGSWRVVALALAAVSLLPLGIGVIVESHDPSCAACHLPPERAFVARAASGEPVDLASAHAETRVRCIDCHGGPGVAGRLRSLTIGARDTAAWLRADYVVVGTDYAPLGELAYPISNAVCVACHEDVVVGDDFERHFHHQLQAPAVPADLRCATCHAGHRPRPGAAVQLTDADTAYGCQRCHAAMGGPNDGLGRREGLRDIVVFRR